MHARAAWEEETEEETAARLVEMKVNARVVQGEETEEETAARLVEKKVHARAAQEEEPEEERAARLVAAQGCSGKPALSSSATRENASTPDSAPGQSTRSKQHAPLCASPTAGLSWLSSTSLSTVHWSFPDACWPTPLHQLQLCGSCPHCIGSPTDSASPSATLERRGPPTKCSPPPSLLLLRLCTHAATR